MFRCMTLEDRCEFLKLSIESFSKISKVSKNLMMTSATIMSMPDHGWH